MRRHSPRRDFVASGHSSTSVRKPIASAGENDVLGRRTERDVGSSPLPVEKVGCPFRVDAHMEAIVSPFESPRLAVAPRRGQHPMLDDVANFRRRDCRVAGRRRRIDSRHLRGEQAVRRADGERSRRRRRPARFVRDRRRTVPIRSDGRGGFGVRRRQRFAPPSATDDASWGNPTSVS